MVGLKKSVKGFTLVETLVSGIIISILTGISMVIYLNVAASLTNTQQLLESYEMERKIDSLSVVKGAFELMIPMGLDKELLIRKTNFEDKEHLYLISSQLSDTLGNVHNSEKRIVHEVNTENKENDED